MNRDPQPENRDPKPENPASRKRQGNMSTYNEAKARCHVRSAIYRASAPEFMFWKNHPIELDGRVPEYDKTATDWKVFDPKEGDAK